MQLTTLRNQKSWLKTILPVIFVLVTLLSIFGCGSKNDAKALFWEVRSPEGEVRGYLLGSVHALDKDFYPFRDEIEDAFSESDVLAVEIDMSGNKMNEAAAIMMKEAFYQGTETIKDHISEETYELLAKRVKELNLGDIDTYKKYKPWMLGTIIMGFELQNMGLDYNHGVDKYFMDRASKNPRQKIVELESLDFQMKLFMGMSEKEAEMFLLSMISEVDAMKTQLKALVAAWKQGDAKQLNDIMNSQIDKTPELKEFSKRLLDDRNVGMAEKFMELMQKNKKKKYFVVVGAAHMVGETGVVRLLEAEGYTVTQK